MLELSKAVRKDREIKANLIDIGVHFFLAVAGACVIYFNSGNLVYAFLFITGGVLIDLDHLIDYFMYFKKGFDLKSFFSNYYILSGKIHIFLHSWEIIFLIFVLGIFIGSYGILAFASGLAVHVLTDSVVHRKILLYFLIFRMVKKFDIKQAM